MSAWIASAIPGYWTLTATSRPSRSVARCTWPIEAEAIGCSPKSANVSARLPPRSSSTTLRIALNETGLGLLLERREDLLELRPDLLGHEPEVDGRERLADLHRRPAHAAEQLQQRLRGAQLLAPGGGAAGVRGAGPRRSPGRSPRGRRPSRRCRSSAPRRPTLDPPTLSFATRALRSRSFADQVIGESEQYHLTDQMIGETETVAERKPTRAEQRAATRLAIIEATVDCLTDDGYAALTTRAVADRAGIAQSTVMHHFETREALLVEAVTHVAFRLAEDALDRVDLAALRAPEQREAVLDEAWREFSSPQALAAAQLWAAVWTEPDLAPTLRELEERIGS